MFRFLTSVAVIVKVLNPETCRNAGAVYKNEATAARGFTEVMMSNTTGRPKLAYLGPEGTYSHQVRHLFL